MDHIDKTFATQSIDEAHSSAIRASLNLGKRTVNRYYQLTDSSEVYRIAMGKYPLAT